MNPVIWNLIEKVRDSLEYIIIGSHLLNKTPVAQTLKTAINKWVLLRLRIFCKAKDIINKTKWQPTEWEKIFTNPTTDRE